jgi:tetratricopeptide (TPR) repeat protein
MMILQLRSQVFCWTTLFALVLLAIDCVARTGWLGSVVMVLLVGPFVYGVFRVLEAKRKEFVFSVVYVLGAFFIFGIYMIMIEAGDRGGAAVVLVLMGLYIGPILLEIPMVLAYSCMRLLSVMGGNRDYYRGAIHALEGRREEALASLSRYQQQDPQDPRGWVGLALSLVNAGRYEEALEKADRALELKRTPEGLLFRGRILLILGAAEEALADIQAALASKRPLSLLLAVALIELRRLDGALAVLKRERFWRKNSQYFWALGEVHRLCRRGDLASKAYEKAANQAALVVKAGMWATEGTLACLLARQGKLAQAEEVVRSLLSKDASDTVALGAQALIQRQRGDYDGVEATLQRKLALNPSYVVGTLIDPDFTPLLAEERFRRLLAQALEERERILERVRNRPQPPQVNGPSGLS